MASKKEYVETSKKEALDLEEVINVINRTKTELEEEKKRLADRKNFFLARIISELISEINEDLIFFTINLKREKDYIERNKE